MEIEAQYKFSKDFISRPGYHFVYSWYTYYAVIILECLTLAAPASVLLQAEGLNLSEWVRYALIVPALFITLLIFHALSIKAASLIQSSALEDYRLGLARLQHDKSSYAPPFQIRQIDRSYVYIASALAVAFLLFLGYNRAFIISGHRGVSEAGTLTYLVLIGLTICFFTLALLFFPGYSIWSQHRKLKNQVNKHKRKRDRMLYEFSRLMSSLGTETEPDASFISQPELSEEAQLCRKRERALTKDNGNYECLVPLQRQPVQVLAMGGLAPNVRVAGITYDQQIQIGHTDGRGRYCLRFRSFKPRLRLLCIGNQVLKNIKVSNQPMHVELFENSAQVDTPPISQPKNGTL